MSDSRRIEILREDTSSSHELPYANFGIQAGFPSPAQDYLDQAIDLNKVLIRKAPTTFCGRVRGDSLMEDDICDGNGGDRPLQLGLSQRHAISFGRLYGTQ